MAIMIIMAILIITLEKLISDHTNRWPFPPENIPWEVWTVRVEVKKMQFFFSFFLNTSF